jgi:CRP/FNR family transcriptional regulator, cyclic AMP receptor protein
VQAAVRVLESDPELGLRVPPDRIAQARRTLVAPLTALPRGCWEVPGAAHGQLGFLLLDGVLGRDVILAGTTCTELLGAGDVIEPSAPARDDRLVHFHLRWQVVEPVRMAVLDAGFSRRLGEWPQVANALLERSLRRALRATVHQALLQLSPVETRLLVLLWCLAERWGRVTRDGIALRLPLSHRLLGQLVGCQRASVTTALQRVVASGRAQRRDDGTWLLYGSPPDELEQLHWQPREYLGHARSVRRHPGLRSAPR